MESTRNLSVLDMLCTTKSCIHIFFPSTLVCKVEGTEMEVCDVNKLRICNDIYHEIRTGSCLVEKCGEKLQISAYYFYAGYYMFIESSSPRLENDTARLYSPVFTSQLTASQPSCFIFWYHMYGATTGM
jgi:hypothetical protein